MYVLRISISQFRTQENTFTNYKLKPWPLIINKHCEILVSCSDEERNCILAHETACKLVELHVSSLNLTKIQGTACKLRELPVSSCNCLQAHVTACKLM